MQGQARWRRTPPLPAAPIHRARCATTPARVDSASALAAHRDTPVTVSGERTGPAKLGDFVLVDGQPVYFAAEAAGDVPYGGDLVLEGVLRHIEPPVEPGCGEGCERADMPAHWRLDEARRIR